MAATPNTKNGSHPNRIGTFSSAASNDVPQVTTPRKPIYKPWGRTLINKKVITPRQ